jgi:hypothetical protein
MPIRPYFTLVLALLSIQVSAQLSDASLAPLLQPPRSYAAMKTDQEIAIDGKASEDAWSKAPWSETFVDIEGKPGKVDPYKTRYKLLWDDNYVYIYVNMVETDIWAKLKEHDQVIFQDDALEIFIDPDGDAHQYMEFQINAFEAIWDLMLTKPYRNGGQSVSGWDIKGLKKAVLIDGTLNDPSDKDKSWSIELAFPLKALNLGGRQPNISGTRWRMQFARVKHDMEVKDGVYEYKKDPKGRSLQPEYYVWTPQGLISLHYPERFGYVTFADGKSGPSINPPSDKLRLTLWKYYYLQQDFKERHGTYAISIADLKKDFPAVTFSDDYALKLLATQVQFTIQSEDKTSGKLFAIDHEGKLTERTPGATTRR